jgi:hypothetical protein
MGSSLPFRRPPMPAWIHKNTPCNMYTHVIDSGSPAGGPFLNGSLTRLIDPGGILKGKIVEFVGRGNFGLASDRKADGSYERVWL